MPQTDTMAFWTVFLIIFFSNLIIPVVAVGFGEDYISYDSDNADPTSPPSLSDYFGIGALSILLIPFWTLGMPTLLNLCIMIPLRVLAWILVLRMIRGN